MATECIQKDFGFHPLKHREIRAQFDGGAITAEGGGLLLREVEKRIGIVRQFAACFRDYRNADQKSGNAAHPHVSDQVILPK